MISSDSFPKQIYANRRLQLAKTMLQKSDGGVLILETAPEHFRNRDSDYPYRHDSDFYYLTGFTEPGATLVMLVEKTSTRSILFCRPKDLEREIWDGWRLGPEAAPTFLGIDQAYSCNELDQLMPDFIADQPAIYARLSGSSTHQQPIKKWLDQVKAMSRTGATAPNSIEDVEAIIHEMRLFKDAHELNIMRQAGRIAAKGHISAMLASKPGLREYHLEASLLYEFRNAGAQSVAYNSIVAAGANACVLHHRAGNALLNDGELCLIDAGCELDGYASDITRTFPINGKFSGPRRAIYDIVLAAQEAAIEKTKIGFDFQAPHEAALRVLTQGMLDLNLLNKSTVGSLDNALETKAYQKFYMHRTSHWLGMDVHDVGQYREPQNQAEPKPWRSLQANMVLTIEPGLYIRPADDVDEQYWNIGIRIEDDALVTENDCELMSRDVPVKASEIEYLMKHSS